MVRYDSSDPELSIQKQRPFGESSSKTRAGYTRPTLSSVTIDQPQKVSSASRLLKAIQPSNDT
ncbi:hypothetical protein E2C01_016902 [Portunus trituberculatus]|uniref:Uncharacterized protein n=1 Tax=Portunus trituberculatus TaxID=210409 RepID=A0A5B7DRG5_PORTR|nr:hypothetical protein [Portunus trituberculatus]